MDKTLIELTGLWENETKDGDTFFSGSLGRAKVLVFRNKYKKEGSNDPDYKMMLAPQEKKEKSGDAPLPVDDTDIPF